MAALTQLCYEDWANLPDLILVQVLSYLSETDVCRAGATCKRWLQCSKAPEVWRYFRFTTCCYPSYRKRLKVKVCELYGHFCHFMTLDLPIYPDAESQKNVISVLEIMSSLESIHLSSLSILFSLTDSPFYVDGEFWTAFEKLFTKIGEKKEQSTLKTLNLHGSPGKFNEVINMISANCHNLEYFNILNGNLPCKYSPHSIMNLVLNCNRLQELHLSYTNLSDHVLNALAQTDRTPLKRMEIICFGEPEHYGCGLSSKAWSSLCSASPDLKVLLTFHHSCPHHYILEIMIPEIPVQGLRFLHYTCQREINTAAANYGHTLERLLVIKLSLSESDSLLNVARRCKKLRTLVVFSVLCSDVVDEILELSPLLRKTRDFLLPARRLNLSDYSD